MSCFGKAQQVIYLNRIENKLILPTGQKICPSRLRQDCFLFFFNPIFNLKNSRANSFSLRTFEMANGKLTNWELIIPLAGKGWNFYLEIVLDESKLIATLVKGKKMNYVRPNPSVYRRITASVCSIPFFPHRNLKSNYQ